MIQHNPIPTHESTILLFVMHLATSGLSHTTIKLNLSAICSMHVATGQHTVFSSTAYSTAAAGPKRHTTDPSHL